MLDQPADRAYASDSVPWFVFVFGGLTMFCLSITLSTAHTSSFSIFLLFSGITYANYQITRNICLRGPNILNILFWIYMAYIYMLPAVVQISTTTYYWPGSYDREHILEATLILLIAIFSYTAGEKIAAQKIRFAFFPYSSGHFTNVYAFPIFLLSIISILYSAYIINRVGVGTLLASRGAVEYYFGDISLPALGFILDLPRVLSYISLILVLNYLASHYGSGHQNRFFPLMIILLIPIIVFYFVMNYPLALTRFWFFGMILGFLFCYYDFDKSYKKGILVIGFILSVYTIFFAYQVINRGSYLNFEIVFLGLLKYLTHADFSNFQQLMNAIDAVEVNGLAWGKQMLGSILFFVPRSIWLDKPFPTGVLIADVKGYGFTNLSSSIETEFFVDFGYLGVCLGMGLVGFALRKLDDIFFICYGREELRIHRIALSVLAGFLVIILRGSLLAIMSIVFTAVACLMAVYLWGRLRIIK